MEFKNLEIKSEYRTTSSNIVKEFYLPILSLSVKYQRAVGFFSSSALVQILDGIENLIKNNGKIQLIISPILSQEDTNAIINGYYSREKLLELSISRILDEFFEVKNNSKVILLSKLIELNILDIKMAFLNKKTQIGMFHEKLGILTDNKGDFIAFSGSLNETETAYSYNVECIDVFKSWDPQDKDRAISKKIAFERMWKNEENGINIIEFPDVAIEKIKLKASDIKDSETNYLFDEGNQVNDITVNESEISGLPKIPKELKIRDYQNQAIDNWFFNSNVGIFDMATGTGKTITGILALNKLFRTRGRLVIVIVAPYTHLVEQWVQDLKWFNINPIVGYSDAKYSNYLEKLKYSINDYKLGVENFMCFITTNASFRTSKVQSVLNNFPSDTLLIVDEAHNFGSDRLRISLPDKFRFRLALSATLDRHNDPNGTRFLYNYFGSKCIEYSLEKAINERMLSKYRYYPIIVNLSDEELLGYTLLTIEIAKHIKLKDGKTVIDDVGKMLLLKRARIVAGAKNKIPKLLEYVNKYKEDDSLLVYCGATNMINDDVDAEEVRQIEYISEVLYRELKMKTSRFTSMEDRQTREKIIDLFKQKRIQGIIAIKCLDEGVNIPSIKTAFILASSTNPKEYIQRRGRVLRLSSNKEFSEIYDFIVLPRELKNATNLSNSEKESDLALVKRELIRLYEFSKLSMNAAEGFSLIKNILSIYEQISWEEIENEREEIAI